MTQRSIRWTKESVRGPELLQHLPSIVPQALNGIVPISATVMTLGIYVEAAHQSDWIQTAQQIAQTHPARILILSPAPSGRTEDRIDVDVHAAIEENRGPGRPPLLLSECLAMTLYGRIADYWLDWMQPLIRSDLPSYLWWLHAPPTERFRWDLLSNTFDSVIIDSHAFPLDHWLPLITASEDYGIGLMDLDWIRGAAFRHLLAESADDGRALAILEEPDHVVVTSRETTRWPLPSSWLWLSWKLQWKLGLPPCHHPTIDVQHAHGTASVWQFSRGDQSLVLSDAGESWSLHLVENHAVIRAWEEPRWTSGTLDDLRRLLTEGPDLLYRETLQHSLLERTEPL